MEKENNKMSLEEFKEYVHSLDIVDVLSDADIIDEGDVNNRKMLCAFHDEKTPSLMFYENSFNCFGCNQNGDAFEFVMGVNDCSFLEACKLLADALGKELNFVVNPFMDYSRAHVMRDKMKKDWEQYLHDFEEAPDSVKKGAEVFFPLEVGWDKAINYYVLRYTSKTNETLGFTKRRGFELSDDKMKGRYPKWKHSTKENSNIGLCNNVFNLGMAAKQIRQKKEVYLVEGPKDVIPFILSNHKNVVAISGVANINKSFDMLPKFTSAVLSFDDDSAGHGARLGYAKLLSETLSLDDIYGYKLDGLDPYDYYENNNHKLPDKKLIVEVLDKNELKELFNEANPYNKELVIRELMRRDSLTHEQACSFFEAGIQKPKKSIKDEIERLEKIGDKNALRKLKIKYNLE